MLLQCGFIEELFPGEKSGIWTQGRSEPRKSASQFTELAAKCQTREGPAEAALPSPNLLIHSLAFFKIAHPFSLPSWPISVEFYTYWVFGILCLISRYVLRLSAFVALSGAA